MSYCTNLVYKKDCAIHPGYSTPKNDPADVKGLHTYMFWDPVGVDKASQPGTVKATGWSVEAPLKKVNLKFLGYRDIR